MLFEFDNGWIACALAIFSAAITALLSTVATLRWRRKAWPAILLGGFLVPIILYSTIAAIIHSILVWRDLPGGFVVHIGSLTLMAGIVPAFVAYGLVLFLHRHKPGAD